MMVREAMLKRGKGPRQSAQATSSRVLLSSLVSCSDRAALRDLTLSDSIATIHRPAEWQAHRAPTSERRTVDDWDHCIFKSPNPQHTEARKLLRLSGPMPRGMVGTKFGW